MKREPQNEKFCYSCDANSDKIAMPVSLRFEFILGNITELQPDDGTGWRTMPFHLCCQSPDRTTDTMVEIRGRELLKCPPGGVIFIPQGVPHRLSGTNPSGVHSVWLHFNAFVHETIDLFSFYDMPILIPAAETVEISRLIRGLVSQPKQLDLTGSLMQQLLGFRLICELVSFGTPKTDSGNLDGKLQRLAPVLRFLRNNPRSFTTAELAAMCSLSPSRFLAVFREATGASPHACRDRFRYGEACRLLMVGDRSISEIAEHLGYGDIYHFSRKFKNMSGMSPRAFRDRSRKRP